MTGHAPSTRWTAVRLKRLRSLIAAGRTWQQIDDALDVNTGASRHKSAAMGYHTPTPRPHWTEPRLKRLREMIAAGKTWQQIGDAFGITRNTARIKAVRMGYHMATPHTRWTPAMDAVLSRHYRPGAVSRLALRLGVTEHAVRLRAHRLGLATALKNPRHYWTPEQDQVLLDRYPHECTRGLAREMGLRMAQLHARSRRLGLRKTAEYKATLTQHIKGIPLPPSHGRHRAVGGVYMQRRGPAVKISNDRWTSLPRAIWKRERGHIPKGHVITYRKGREGVRPQHLTIDDIECITRAQLMQRNSVHHVRTKPMPESARAYICPERLRRHNNPPWTMRQHPATKRHDFTRRTR